MSEDTKALATVDQSLLDQWKESNDGQDADTGRPQIAILKINQKDPECQHGLGSWIVGLKRDENDEIVDHGKKVKGIVILAVRNRYSYYDVNDTSKNCSSHMFASFDEVVVGSRYKYNCTDKSCPMRTKEGNPRCKAQKVAVCVAVCEDGTQIDCVSYLQGDTYMPFSNYIKNAKMIKTQGGFAEAPLYAFATILESEKKKNGGVTYWAGKFTRGQLFGTEHFSHFREKHFEALKFVEAANKAFFKGDEGTGAAATATAPATATPATVTKATVATKAKVVEPAKKEDEVIDVAVVETTLPGLSGTLPMDDDDIPFDKGVGSTGSATSAESSPSGFDITAAIQAALKS